MSLRLALAGGWQGVGPGLDCSVKRRGKAIPHMWGLLRYVQHRISARPIRNTRCCRPALRYPLPILTGRRPLIWSGLAEFSLVRHDEA